VASGQMAREPRYRGSHILLLGPARVVGPFGGARPTEVEAEGRVAGGLGDLGGPDDHGIVHVAPVRGWGWQTTKPPVGLATAPSRASRAGPPGTRMVRASSIGIPDLRVSVGIFKGQPRHSLRGILPMMPSLGCLWSRPRLERLVDGALGPRAGRWTTSHAARCARLWRRGGAAHAHPSAGPQRGARRGRSRTGPDSGPRSVCASPARRRAGARILVLPY